MARKIIVVTAAYGNDHVKALGGQSAVLPFIAGSGAAGVEIRRELFSADELNHLPELAADIERRGLLVCYSAPEALFTADGSLNPRLADFLQEAQTLNALWLKLSLGRFTHQNDLDTLRDRPPVGLTSCRSPSPLIWATGCGLATRRKRPRATWRLPSAIFM